MNHLLLSPISIADFETLIRNCVKSELNNFSPISEKSKDEYITTKGAIEILGVSKVTLAKWRSEGKIEFYRAGTRIRFKKSELLNVFQAPKKYGKDKDISKKEVK